jgi:Ni/Co efflux regulator RcnB
MRKFLTAALALTVVGSAGVASAQPRYNDHDRRDNDQRRDEVRRDAPGDRGASERRASRRYNAGRYQPPAGYRAHRWGRGERLPQSYRSRSYVVDYRRYGLGAPPRGYEYVRVGNDVVLTAVATGVIASVVANLFQ